MADGFLNLKNIPEVLHTGKEAQQYYSSSLADDNGYTKTRKIKVPGQAKEQKVEVPGTEGYYGEGKDVHDRIIKAMDKFVKDVTFKGAEMTYKLEGEIVTNDTKRAFSRKNTELLLVFEDDNNEWGGVFQSTVGNGIRLNIGDNGELTAEILQNHRIDNTNFLGHADGRAEDEAIIEDLMVRNNTMPVFNSAAKAGEAGSGEAGEKFMGDVIKYFGQHLGVEHEYLLELDSDFNPVVQKGMLAFMTNYFDTLDYHIKSDGNKQPFMNNLEKMLPMLVKELSYGCDDVDQSDWYVGKNSVSARTIMKEATGDENLISTLAGYYGLGDEIKEAKAEDKLTELEKIFTQTRELVKDASDYDVVSQDYANAYASAVQDKLGLSLTHDEVKHYLSKYIISAEKANEFIPTEMKEFLKDIKHFEEKQAIKSAPAAKATPSVDTSPKANWYATVAALENNASASQVDRFMAKLIKQNHSDIQALLTTYAAEEKDIQAQLILSALKRTDLGKETITTPTIESSALAVINKLVINEILIKK